MNSCKHEKFQATMEVARIEDTGRFMAEVGVRCTECGTPFQFFGLPVGFNYDRAMMSIDSLEAHLPICPQGEKPTMLDEGEAAGFEIRARGVDSDSDEVPPEEKH